MLPFKLTPAYKNYLWGGNLLKEKYKKNTNCTPLAESWELSAHPDGASQIATGPLKGLSFLEFVKKYPQEWGAKKKEDTFPVLVKLIDAKQSLSIQVHPTDAYALQQEGEYGKTEMWVILQAQPGAFLYYGFTQPVSKEEFAKRIEENTITEVLHKQKVSVGDVIYIPAGTIHAIGAGIVLAEVQQSSNATYRVYDFARVGADGKQRPLHIQKALEVTQRQPASKQVPGAQIIEEYPLQEQLVKCSYFTTTRITLKNEQYRASTKGYFLTFLCISGTAELQCDEQTLQLQQGECAFVPVSAPTVTLQGNAQLLMITCEQ